MSTAIFQAVQVNEIGSVPLQVAIEVGRRQLGMITDQLGKVFVVTDMQLQSTTPNDKGLIDVIMTLTPGNGIAVVYQDVEEREGP